MQTIKDKINKIEIVTAGIVELIDKIKLILQDTEIPNLSPDITNEIFYHLINNYKFSPEFAYDLTKLLCNTVYQKYEFLIIDNQKTSNELITEKIKRNFGTNIKISALENIKIAIKQIKKNDNLILCESINNNISDGWWIYLLETNKEIFTKLNPDFEENNQQQTHYAIAKLNTKQNYDRSFIIIETSAPVGQNWIKTVLIKLKIPVYRVVESVATYKKNVIHLIEITGNIDENDNRIGKELKINNIKFEILKKIGGYFQKINSEENNQLLFLK